MNLQIRLIRARIPKQRQAQVNRFSPNKPNLFAINGKINNATSNLLTKPQLTNRPRLIKKI